jgi:hypothetical protein
VAVTLSKVSDQVGTPVRIKVSTRRERYPWYPLYGHRSGLRANDPVSLASAFWIMALEGGTAHLSTDLIVNQGCN